MPIFRPRPKTPLVRRRSDSLPSMLNKATTETVPVERHRGHRTLRSISRPFTSNLKRLFSSPATPYADPADESEVPFDAGRQKDFCTPVPMRRSLSSEFSTPLDRHLSLSLNSLVTACTSTGGLEPRYGGTGLVSSTSVQELRKLASQLEEGAFDMSPLEQHSRKASVGSSLSSTPTFIPSIFEESSARTSWESTSYTSQPLNAVLKSGPYFHSPLLVPGDTALARGRSSSALPSTYLLEVKGLEWVAEEWEEGQEGALRGYLEAKLRELMGMTSIEQSAPLALSS